MRIQYLFATLIAIPAFPQTAARPADPLAVVEGQPLYEKDLLPLIQSQLAQLRNQEFDLRSRYLEALINQKVLETEAKKRGMTVDKLLEVEVQSKVPEPPDSELEALYESQKDRINRPLAEVKGQLRQSLKEAKSQQAGEIYMKALREKSAVEVMMEPPRSRVSVDTGRIRGKADAPVTIVEFSDFQCPFCARVQPTLQNVLAKYDGKVRLTFRDLPIREIHPEAEAAAVAARCAGEQGKFWEYHDLIYQNQNAAKLSGAGLTEHARTLQLDLKAFETCQGSGKFQSMIERDSQEAGNLGVSGTPGFFVNGIFLNGAVPMSAFEKVIDRELGLLKRRAQ